MEVSRLAIRKGHAHGPNPSSFEGLILIRIYSFHSTFGFLAKWADPASGS
jgi:hypothetical protein